MTSIDQEDAIRLWISRSLSLDKTQQILCIGINDQRQQNDNELERLERKSVGWDDTEDDDLDPK